jgi:hypothetical protein
LPSPGKRKSLRNRATIGGVAAAAFTVFAVIVIGIVTFIQHRRKQRRSRPSSILSPSNVYWDAGSQTILTPFNPDSLEPTQGLGILVEQQPLVSENTETEMVTPHHLSSLSPSHLPLSRPGTPVFVGLSGKEIMHLHAENLRSQQSHNHSTSNETRARFSPNVDTESGGATSPYDTRRLHSDVESLRREIGRLQEIERHRAEGLITSAPPSYTAEGYG